mmetsp:Transcript_15025/g.38624  ORF Transcript_15025/g.38624 Transcript_15025/m.38624 type:complete len:313 (-) Transcript_15025:956-1894(-)
MGAILIAMPLPLSLCGGQNAQDAVAVAVLAVRRVSGLRIPPRRGEPLSVATVPDVEVRDAALVGPRLEGGMGALVGVHVARHDDVYTRGHQNPFHGVSVEVALPEMIAVAVVPGHVEQTHNPGCYGPVDAGNILQEPLHLRRFVCERQIGVQHNNMCWPVVSREPKRRRGSGVVVALRVTRRCTAHQRHHEDVPRLRLGGGLPLHVYENAAEVAGAKTCITIAVNITNLGEPPKKLVPPVLDLQRHTKHAVLPHLPGSMRRILRAQANALRCAAGQQGCPPHDSHQCIWSAFRRTQRPTSCGQQCSIILHGN